MPWVLAVRRAVRPAPSADFDRRTGLFCDEPPESQLGYARLFSVSGSLDRVLSKLRKAHPCRRPFLCRLRTPDQSNLVRRPCLVGVSVARRNEPHEGARTSGVHCAFTGDVGCNSRGGILPWERQKCSAPSAAAIPLERPRLEQRDGRMSVYRGILVRIWVSAKQFGPQHLTDSLGEEHVQPVREDY